METLVFGLLDCAIFAAMLVISLSFGLYFGYISKTKNSTTEEYLMGGRKMKVIPVAISMVASLFSSLSVMAFPAEVYSYGINFYLGHLSIILCGLFIYWCVLPIYYNNNISTCYEYLELRFDRATRKLATIAFIGTYILFLPIYLYLPSVALSQVINLNTHVINTIINGVCVFYTMIGGVKAVIWTDVAQGVVMFGVVLFVGIMGVIKNGGISETLRIASDGHRLDVNFTFDLETRVTFWNSMMNNLIYLTAYVGFNQCCVQRLISLPTLKQSKRSLLYLIALYVLLISINCFNGIILYAYFHDCDPISTGRIQKPDGIMPHFVQHIAGHLSGVPGIFIAGLFSASLSTVSAAMNSMAGVAYFDYIKPFVQHTERKANLIIKLLTLAFGIYNILGGILYEQFLSFVQMFSSFYGLFYGALFSCFILGLLVPRVHGRCVFWGMITSILTMLAFMICAHGETHYQPLKYTTVKGCESNFSFVADTKLLSAQSSSIAINNDFNILKMSFNWYIVMGALIVIIVSLILSYILPDSKRAGYNRKLLAPVVHSLVKYQLTKQDENEQDSNTNLKNFNKPFV